MSDLVEAIARFVEGWNGDTSDGDTSCMAEGIRERFASLSHPDSRTEPQEVVERIWLWRNGTGEYVAYRSAWPVMVGGGDPLTLGEPTGWAYLMPCDDGSAGRSNEEAEAGCLRAIASLSTPPKAHERVACNHEAYQGRCVHCDLPICNGRIVKTCDGGEHISINPDGPEAAAALRTKDAEIARYREALEDIGVYGCGMLNQPAAINGPENDWLQSRISRMEYVARQSLKTGGE